MTGNSFSSYQAAGAFGPQEPEDDCSHGVPSSACTTCIREKLGDEIRLLEKDLERLDIIEMAARKAVSELRSVLRYMHPDNYKTICRIAEALEMAYRPSSRLDDGD